MIVRHIRKGFGNGFTLIELLVVIAIISFLSTLVMSSVAKVRASAVYAKAALDLKQVKTALQLYHLEHDSWPTPAQRIISVSNDSNPDSVAIPWSTLATYLGPYISKLPRPDPASENVGAIYAYSKGSPTEYIFGRIWNSLDNQFIGCMVIYDGYYLDFMQPQQTSFTLNDGGLDPDGIEYYEGDVRVYTDPNICDLWD